MQVYQNYIFLIPHNFIKSFFSNKKSPSVNAKGLEMSWLPLLDRFRTFKGNMIIENIKLNQLVFQYVDDKGDLAGYPWNPNGSVNNIAGVCDSTGRILGMMPHPERHFHPTHHPQWTRLGLKDEGDGVQIFRNAINYFN